MVNAIRIAVTGTHSTGKTTLLQRMEMELRAHGVNVARTGGNMATKAAALGFPKLHHQTADTTTWIIAAGVCSELETALAADVVLVDRAALDPFAYWLAAGELRGHTPDPAEAARLRDLVALHCDAYALLIATVLDETVPLGDHRDRDLLLRRTVNAAIHRELTERRTPHYRLGSSPDEQNAVIKTVLSTLS